MHDEPGVGMGQRVAHLQGQSHDRGDTQPVAPAVGVDGFARHPLEREPGPPEVGLPGVVQAGDVRMLQRGEQGALAGHALHQSRRPAGSRQLQRHLSLQRAVAPLRRPDGRHAALAEQLEQAPRPDEVAGRIVRGSRLRQRLHRQRLAHEVVGLRRGTAQHRPQLRLQRGIGRCQAVDVALAPLRR